MVLGSAISIQIAKSDFSLAFLSATDGALVRVITSVGKNEAVEQADVRMQEFTVLILPVLNDSQAIL